MPDLPQIESQVAPQVQPSAEMPVGAVSADALGAGIGAAVLNTSDVAHRVWFDAQQRANQAASLEGSNSNNDFVEKALRDPKTGLLNQYTGKDAPAATQQVLQAFDDHVAKTTDGMANDQQKFAYQRISQAHRFELQRQLDAYEHAQTEQFALDVHNKAVNATVTKAVNNAGNPEAVADALNEQKALVADYGKGRMSQEAIDLQTQQHSSATQLAVIEHLTATGQDQAAKQVLDSAADGLMPHDRLAAEKLVDAGSTLGQAQRWTDANVVDQHGDMRSRTDVDADVNKISDPKVRAKTQELVEQRFNEAEKAHQYDQKQLVDRAMNLAGKQGPNAPAVQALVAQMDTSYADVFKTRFAKDGAIKTDDGAMNLMVQMAHDDPDKFLNAVDSPKVPLTYAPADYQKLLTMRDEIRREGGIGKTGRDLETDAKAVQAQLHALGIDDKDHQEQASAFRAAYDMQKRAAMDANGGKALLPQDKDALAKALAADHATTVVRSAINPARWFGSATTKDTDGKVYTKDDATIRESMPLPGTGRQKDGQYLTRHSLDAWAIDAARGRITDSDKADLARMAKGIDEDGRFDPAVRRRYEFILEAINAAKAKP